MEKWQTGLQVWHRADGKRGVILEHTVAGDGFVRIGCCFGSGAPIEKCALEELSAVRIGDGSEGEDWKEGAEPAP